MALPVWGNLTKSQIDSEKIEEAIARLIQEHEDDPDAHLEVGESLQSHKASEIIDHLAVSIIADKIARGAINLTQFSMEKLNFFTCFETFDGWSNIDIRDTARILGAEIEVVGAGTDTNWIYINPIVSAAPLIWSKDPFFQISGQLKYSTDQLLYFGMGSAAIIAFDNFVGFKIDNATLYAIIVAHPLGVRTEYTTEITGINIQETHIYRAEYNSDDDEVRFYVDGVLKTTEDVEEPLDNENVIFTIRLKRTAVADKSFHPNYLLWSQDL